jgi:hypothetical protein
VAGYILGGVALVFLIISLERMRETGAAHPQVRVWLLIAAVLGIISAWLFAVG